MSHVASEALELQGGRKGGLAPISDLCDQLDEIERRSEPEAEVEKDELTHKPYVLVHRFEEGEAVNLFQDALNKAIVKTITKRPWLKAVGVATLGNAVVVLFRPKEGTES